MLPAIAIAIDAGMNHEEVADAITHLNYIPGKLSLQQKNEAVIINDSGNSNLNGFLAAIDTLKLFNRDENYILSKGIIELGNEKADSYKKIVMQIESANFKLVTTDKLFKQFDSKNIVTIVHNESGLYSYIVSKLNAKTALLLEGKFSKKFVNKFV